MTHREAITTLLTHARTSGKAVPPSRLRDAARHVLACRACIEDVGGIHERTVGALPELDRLRQLFGCEQLALRYPELASLSAPALVAAAPDVATHLGWCLACRDDFSELRAVAREAAEADRDALRSWRRVSAHVLERIDDLVMRLRRGALSLVPQGDLTLPALASVRARGGHAPHRLQLPIADSGMHAELTITPEGDRHVRLDVQVVHGDRPVEVTVHRMDKRTEVPIESQTLVGTETFSISDLTPGRYILAVKEGAAERTFRVRVRLEGPTGRAKATPKRGRKRRGGKRDASPSLRSAPRLREPAVTPEAAPGSNVPWARVRQADAIPQGIADLRVEQTRDRLKYELAVRDEGGAPPTVLTFERRIRAADLDGILARFDGFVRRRPTTRFLVDLKALGSELHDALFPDDLWDQIDRLTVPLLIRTCDLWLPFELSYAGAFLGVRHAVGHQVATTRVFRGVPSREDVTADARQGGDRRALVIGVDPGDLPGIAGECEAIRKCFSEAQRPSYRVTVLQNDGASIRNVVEKLGHGYDVIHFCGHVTTDRAREPALELAGGGRLTATAITRAVHGRPFVFLNGCASARHRRHHGVQHDVYGVASAFLRRHARAVVGTWCETPDDQSGLIATTLYRQALSGVAFGEALRCTREAALADGAAASHAWLAFVLYGDPTGRLEKAAPVRETSTLLRRFEAAVAAAEASHGHDSPRLVQPLVALTHAYRREGRLRDAFAVQERILAIRERHDGDGDRNTAIQRNNLAEILRDIAHDHALCGRKHEHRETFERARALYERALSAIERTATAQDGGLATVLSNLGNCLTELDHLEAAEALHRRALAIRLRIGNPALVSQCHHSLGIIHRRQRKYAAAEADYRRAMKLTIASVGTESNAYATCLQALGVLEHDQGRLVTAERYLREALTLRQRLLPPANPDLRATRANLRRVLESMGRAKEADALVDLEDDGPAA